ncbi:MAG: DUF418 domain-containing protein [Gammaproteobacteria bacterium]|uniref:DUF418 domain-containing protein n=1 Tax=Candidatus Thiopontia autotrophica TaxID=2841688 RepID=A0A8J6P5G0_9GAMM|nr:DUF418 domain-containing protein [Candidatus Thiopontia autotrophica]MBL6968837.1 DUF418 domain-containing protein [Gammaproteobacteria bacterium]
MPISINIAVADQRSTPGSVCSSCHGSFQRYELLLIALLFGLMQMVISTLWLRYFLYGSLEWAWRSLVRIEFQRIRLSSAYP